MRFQLNFAHNVYVNRRMLYIGYGAVISFLFLLLCINVVNMVFLQNQMEQLRSYEKTMATARAQKNGSGRVVQPLDAMVKDVRFANRILEERRFSWMGFLDQLESLAGKKIKIRSIQPDFGKKDVRLQALAADLGDMQDFLQRLSEDAAFNDYFLLEQGRTSYRKPESPARDVISFSLVVKGVI